MGGQPETVRIAGLAGWCHTSPGDFSHRCAPVRVMGVVLLIYASMFALAGWFGLPD